MVTAVIPAHGRVELLQRAIDSVLAQRDCEVELIVVDDGSGLELEGPYQVLRQPRQGPGPARNLGARHGRGEWLALLDSDDVWEPDKCRSQLDYLVAGGFRAGLTQEWWIRSGKRAEPPLRYRPDQGELLERTASTLCVSCSSLMIERDFFWQLGGFDPRLFVCEDYEFALRLCAATRLGVVEQRLTTKYGGHPVQLSRQVPALDRLRLMALLEHIEQFPKLRAAALEKVRILVTGAAKRAAPGRAIYERVED
ncbi:MAG: glycosyltransferase family 2 protein, partial [Candidatus Eremiobacteraeota bacterium]|nr:glycosyltransferase family 2 protein [Candidatus Eremiobacteraeota bacterium]